MTANPHLVPQLDAFVAVKEPGFAMQIDAPWGAGKTHAVKAWLKDKKHVYVSLFGVASPEAVEDAVFATMLTTKDKWLGKPTLAGVDQVG